MSSSRRKRPHMPHSGQVSFVAWGVTFRSAAESKSGVIRSSDLGRGLRSQLER
jgi:hypothetical protein